MSRRSSRLTRSSSRGRTTSSNDSPSLQNSSSSSRSSSLSSASTSSTDIDRFLQITTSEQENEVLQRLTSLEELVPVVRGIEEEFKELRVKNLKGFPKFKHYSKIYGRWVVWVWIICFILPCLLVYFHLHLSAMNLDFYNVDFLNEFCSTYIQEEYTSLIHNNWITKKTNKFLEYIFISTAMYCLVPFYQWLSYQETDRFEAKKNRQKLSWTRLNFSLNMLQQDEQTGEHKIVMRTINEDTLSTIFTDKMDSWVFAQITNLQIPSEVAPFLTLSVIAPTMWHSTESLFKHAVRKCRDQIVNRVSTLFGLGYVALDLGMEVNTAEYIFGVTHEKQTDKRNRKVRVLLMRKDQLKKMVSLRASESPFEHDSWLHKDPQHTTSMYVKDRMKHLTQMYKLYKENKRQDKYFMEKGLVETTPSRGTIIGSVYISSQGTKL